MTATNGNGHAPPLSPELLSRVIGPIVNAMTQPFSRIRQLMDPRRDVDAECGYPSLNTPVPVETYQQLYDRDAIAARVVEVYPKECWQVTPTVYEEEDSESPTPFEQVLDALGAGLHEEESCYDGEEGGLLAEAWRRADIVSGIGSYGVILLGFNDGLPLSQPAFGGKVAQYAGDRKLTFLRPLPESLAYVTGFEADVRSRRFGRPTQYNVTLNDPREQFGGAATAAMPSTTSAVHWSRVVHVADVGHQAPTSEVFVPPRMRCVLNNLLGLHKLYACAPEMYWLAALPILKFTTHAQLGGDVQVDVEGIRDLVEQVRNGLQRTLTGEGGDWGTVAPSVVDPTSQIAVQIEAICIKLGCPVRVFKGSERGELASSQDDQAWNDRLKERQNGYITPRVIAPFVNRLISLGILPRPKRFKVWWPDLTSETDGQKADVMLKRVQALSAYVGGNVESIMAPADFYTRELGYDEEEAAAILDNASGALPPDDGAGTDLGQEAQSAYPPEPSVNVEVDNAWSEASRAAALEARRAKMKGKGEAKPQPKAEKSGPAKSAGKGKPADVKVKAAADKVARINAKVTAAKAKLASLTSELKAAKADLAKVKGAVKEGAKKEAGAGKGPTKADVAAKGSATKVKDIMDRAVAVAAKSKSLEQTGKVDIALVTQQVREAVGKSSPHKVAKEMGFRQKFKSAADAMGAIERKVITAIGTVERVHA